MNTQLHEMKGRQASTVKIYPTINKTNTQANPEVNECRARNNMVQKTTTSHKKRPDMEILKRFQMKAEMPKSPRIHHQNQEEPKDGTHLLINTDISL